MVYDEFVRPFASEDVPPEEEETGETETPAEGDATEEEKTSTNDEEV